MKCFCFLLILVSVNSEEMESKSKVFESRDIPSGRGKGHKFHGNRQYSMDPVNAEPSPFNSNYGTGLDPLSGTGYGSGLGTGLGTGIAPGNGIGGIGGIPGITIDSPGSYNFGNNPMSPFGQGNTGTNNGYNSPGFGSNVGFIPNIIKEFIEWLIRCVTSLLFSTNNSQNLISKLSSILYSANVPKPVCNSITGQCPKYYDEMKSHPENIRPIMTRIVLDTVNDLNRNEHQKNSKGKHRKQKRPRHKSNHKKPY